MEALKEKVFKVTKYGLGKVRIRPSVIQGCPTLMAQPHCELLQGPPN